MAEARGSTEDDFDGNPTDPLLRLFDRVTEFAALAVQQQNVVDLRNIAEPSLPRQAGRLYTIYRGMMRVLLAPPEVDVDPDNESANTGESADQYLIEVPVPSSLDGDELMRDPDSTILEAIIFSTESFILRLINRGRVIKSHLVAETSLIEMQDVMDPDEIGVPASSDVQMAEAREMDNTLGGFSITNVRAGRAEAA